MEKNKSYEMYAGFHCDNTYVPLTRLDWEESYAPKGEQGLVLTQHCDVYDRSLMEEVVRTAGRSWKLDRIVELWITLMPGTFEVAISLKPEEGHPSNFKISGQTAHEILNLVNSWAEGWAEPCSASLFAGQRP